MNVLIGYSGFVGSFLSGRRRFDRLFNSRNFERMAGGRFDRIVCAGLPAAKWIANREPEADFANIEALCNVLRTVRSRQFVLVSTVDVYPRISGVDESFDCHSIGNNAYGSHRLMFEDFVREEFADALVLRLPALFGRGLKKNIVYDLLHDNCLHAINPESTFQWYDLERLWGDIDAATAAGLSLVGLTTAPVSTRQILDRFFPDKTVGANAGPEVHYDVRTRYAEIFGGEGGYIMAQQEVMQRLGRYIASQSVETAA